MNDVIVIGGGVAGLSAGIYCEKNGLSCTLIEKNLSCGGNLTGWSREGCYIDNCTHWLTGTLPGSELFGLWKDIGMLDDLGSLYQGEVFYETEINGQRISFSRYPETTRLNMLLRSAEDRKEINRFIDAVEAVADHMTDGRVTKELALACARYRYLSLKALGERFRSPLLSAAFTDYICGEFSAIFLIWSYAAFVSGNGRIPRGGSKSAANRIERRFAELGGNVRCSSEVVGVTLDGDEATGVLLADGEYIRARAIICACDPYVTFNKLLPIAHKPRAYSSLCRNDERAPCFSSVQAAFLCDSDAIPGFGTRVIDCRFPNAADGSRLIVREYSYEPSFAPKGKTVMQTMLYQDRERCREWISAASDKVAYAERKRVYGEVMLEAVKRAFSLSNDAIKCIDIWTPATYSRYFSSECGAYMAFTLTPSMTLRRHSGRIRGLKNVFVASQWQCSPGGLPNAARAGVSAAGMVGRLLKKRS